MKYYNGDYFIDKDTNKLYYFDGNEWFEVVPAYKLEKSFKMRKIDYDK